MPKPGSGGSTAAVETSKEAFVLSDVATRSRAVLEQEHRHDGRELPPQVSGNPGSQPDLHVKSADGVLGITDHRLDLDHHERSCRRVNGKSVDAPAIAVVIEADLDADTPSAAFEKQYEAILQGRMASVEQAR